MNSNTGQRICVATRRAAASLSLSPVDAIFTHFPEGAEDTLDKGRLGEECARLKEILDDVAKTALEAAKMANLEMSDFPFVGIGSPGVISVETGTVIAAVNLGFDNVPVSKYLSEKFEVPVILENDANAAAYGEFKAGKAKNTENFIAFTIGTITLPTLRRFPVLRVA